MQNKVFIVIRNYFSGWNFTRWFRLALSAAMLAGYFSTKESLYLLGAIFIGAQAVFNLSCPGGSCETPTAKNTKQAVEVKELTLDNKKDV